MIRPAAQDLFRGTKAISADADVTVSLNPSPRYWIVKYGDVENEGTHAISL